MSGEFTSIENARERLASVGYLADEPASLVSFAGRLGKPVLVEGPAGVGKTELAKAVLARHRAAPDPAPVHEGLDEAKALYEWNYRKQLLRIQTEAADTGWQEVKDDIFGEEFMPPPLLSAISAEEPVVLLIDEIDKTDQEFEALLLEVLDFQISIPEMGVSRPARARSSSSPRTTRASSPRRQAPLPLPVARLPDDRARARDRAPARAGARPGRGAQARRGHPHGALARPEEAALDSGVDRLGARCCCSAPRTWTRRCSSARCRSSSSTGPTSTWWRSAPR